ncbi:glycosyltransferase family 2 protein [Brucella pituitosa]|uniref:glycosyltransferase family 2 protein n=1 Tax=Brucella pituitosa TaxID=571256 RepID=UPI003F4A8989
MAPKVSVIVTSYNIRPYIVTCLDTVCNQSLKDIEIIIVDDGSTDGTVDIIKKYAATDDRIKIILFERNTVGGVATAANAGMDIATGEYIGFADGDDIYEPTMFEDLYTLASRFDADLGICNYRYLENGSGAIFDNADNALWHDLCRDDYIQMDTEDRKKILRLTPVPWRKIYRRKFIESQSIRFPVGDFFFEDNPLHWQTVIQAKNAVFVDQVLCYHRMNREGQTISSNNNRLFGIFSQYDIMRDWLLSNSNSEEYKINLLFWLSHHLDWLRERIHVDNYRKFYELAVPRIDEYTKNEIQECSEIYRLSPMSVEFMYALKSKNEKKFSRIASGLYNRSFFNRIIFNVNRVGVLKTIRILSWQLRGFLRLLIDRIRHGFHHHELNDLRHDISFLKDQLAALSIELSKREK